MFIKIRETDGRYFAINPNQIVSIGMDADNSNFTTITTSDNKTFSLKIHFDKVMEFLTAYGMRVVKIN
jgi:uncharacterized protein YlzI (FlbEa/FlbD family)